MELAWEFRELQSEIVSRNLRIESVAAAKEIFTLISGYTRAVPIQFYPFHLAIELAIEQLHQVEFRIKLPSAFLCHALSLDTPSVGCYTLAGWNREGTGMDRRHIGHGNGGARIAIAPDILHGRPRVKGTRIGVSMVLELLARGISPAVIRRRFYPDLTLADIQACVDFANRVLTGEEIHLVPHPKPRRFAHA